MDEAGGAAGVPTAERADQLMRVACSIGPMPQGMFDPMPKVVVTFDDGQTAELFTFYPDKIQVRPEDFIGKEEAEARRLHFEKDRAYLRS
jgi:hypothetical protein